MRPHRLALVPRDGASERPSGNCADTQVELDEYGPVGEAAGYLAGAADTECDRGYGGAVVASPTTSTLPSLPSNHAAAPRLG